MKICNLTVLAFLETYFALVICGIEKKCNAWHDYEMSVAPYGKDKPIYYEFTACIVTVIKLN